MRTVAVTAVFEDGTVPTDGTAPLRVQAVDLAWWQWTDGRIAITAVGSNGSPFDLSGGAFIFTARTRNQAAPPTISHEGVIDDASAGLAHVDIGSVDVGLICQTLAWNLTFIDSGGKIWATTAQGFFSIGPGEYVPGQDVTVPESQQPLAQGPNFGNSDTFADFPAASSKAWLAWVADDTHLAYYSDGTTWRPLAPGYAFTNVPTTPTLNLTSTTAATSSVNQFGPTAEFCSAGWKTASTAASQQACVGFMSAPVKSTTNPLPGLAIYTSQNGGTRAVRGALGWDGTNLLFGYGDAQTSSSIGVYSSGFHLTDNSGVTWEGQSGELYPTNGQGIIGKSDAFLYEIYTGLIETKGSGSMSCSLGTGAGTGGSCSITGTSPTAAMIAITTGTSPTSGGTVATVTFNAADTYDTHSVCSVAPANAAAATGTGVNTYVNYASSSTSAASIGNPGALSASTAFQYVLHCAGEN